MVIGALTAIGAGALIGIERERHQVGKVGVAGLRTFMLFSLLGFVSALLSQLNPLFASIAFAALALAVGLGYYFSARASREFGLTSEVTSLITFLLGFMAFYFEFRNFSVMLAIGVTVLLAFKKREHHLAEQIEKHELYDMLAFLVIVFIILPLLPDQAIDPLGVFNPNRAWLMVVLVSGIGFVGYAAAKFLGAKRGLAVTGLLGGLVSSTSVAFSMAERSKEARGFCGVCVSAVCAASSITFLRILLIVSVVNSALFSPLFFPLLAMFAVEAAAAYYFWKNGREGGAKVHNKLSTPLALLPALKFAALFVLVLFASKLASIYFGESGVFLAAAASGLVSLDAVVLSMAALAGKSVSLQTASSAIFFAAVSSALVKFGVAKWRGTPQFAAKIGIVSGLAAAAGLAAFFLLGRVS